MCGKLRINTSREDLVQERDTNVVGLRSGVPNVLSFGPLLFSLYASKLFDVIHTRSCSLMYLSFCADSIDDQTTALSSMERWLADIRHWKLHDKVKLIYEIK